jgi:hypothetical protein
MSTAHARAIIVLLCLAGAPAMVQSFAGREHADGWRADAVSVRLGAFEGAPTHRQPSWVQRRFASTDFTERTYGPTRLFVVRSFEFTSLYHHPELAVAYRTGATYAGLSGLKDGDRTIPVSVVRSEKGERGLGGYVLLYGQDRFVDRPYWFHVRLAGELLLRPRRPMTLFFVYDETAPPNSSLEDAPCARVLMDAIKSFQAQSTSDARSTRIPALLGDAGVWTP